MNIDEAFLSISKPWNYWTLYCGNRGRNVSELGLEPAGLTKAKDAVELWKPTQCPSWVAVEAWGVEEEGGRSSGGALPDAVRKRHQEMWGSGDWYHQEFGDRR